MPLMEKEMFRFDPFLLDPVERTLMRDGTTVPLTPKAFDTLLCLVRNQGRMVTKDQLLEQVWPDSFVEEVNLAVNISTIRKALGESPQDCRFIATVPGRGYRFIAKVATADAAPALPIATETKPRSSSRTIVLASLLGLSLAAVIGGLYRFPRFSRQFVPLTQKDTIVLADFTNKTGDAVFDDTLRQALSVSLAQSPFLNILSGERVRNALTMMGHSPASPLSVDLALDLCQRTSSTAVFAGSIASLGSQYVLGLNAIDCRTGQMLAQEQVQAARKEDVLRALDRASAKLRGRLGESITTVEKYDTPLEQATTASLDALKAYSQGRKLGLLGDSAGTIPYYKRAIDLDPQFGTAYLALGIEYSNLFEAGATKENIAKAYELRERASERERLSIEANYHTFVTGNLDKARTTYNRWMQAYPRDDIPYVNLGVIEAYIGNYDQAIKNTQDALRLMPDSPETYGNLVGDLTCAGRYDEAKSVYKQAVARRAAGANLYGNMYGLAFLEEDRAEMDRQVAWANGKAGEEDFLLSIASDTEAYYGRNGKARTFSRRAVDSAKRNDQKESAAQWQMEAALREAELGNSAEARQQVRAALALASNHDSQILGALALARAGEFSEAARMANDLAKRYPEDTLVNSYWLPSIRATIELGRNHAHRALEILEAGVPYELGDPTPIASNGAMAYPIYVRGQAYLKLRQGKEAAAEFQKILDHRNEVMNFITGALAHLGLARAYALQGDTARARIASDDFLKLWKDADPDIPMLKQAKAEYPKVQ